MRLGTVREPIVIDAPGRFTVPPARRALLDDAIVRSPPVEGRLAGMVDVRTPDVAEGSRRWGDLRLVVVRHRLARTGVHGAMSRIILLVTKEIDATETELVLPFDPDGALRKFKQPP